MELIILIIIVTWLIVGRASKNEDGTQDFDWAKPPHLQEKGEDDK